MAEKQRSYTMEDYRAIVAAGLSVTEARMLLEEGWEPAKVLELATLQAQKAREAATESHAAIAKGMQKAANPSNPTHPGISCFSYPEGDEKHPKPELPFQFWYLNYPVHMFPETEHWRELELAAKVQPGEFMVWRKDYQPMKVSVKAERDGNLVVTKLMVEFSANREVKDLIPPKSVVLYQLVHQGRDPEEVFLEAMAEHLRLMRPRNVVAPPEIPRPSLTV